MTKKRAESSSLLYAAAARLAAKNKKKQYGEKKTKVKLKISNTKKNKPDNLMSIKNKASSTITIFFYLFFSIFFNALSIFP